jgi:hypothetical protein
MHRIIHWWWIAIISISLSACTHETLTAPCDQYATFCGKKTKINAW